MNVHATLPGELFRMNTPTDHISLPYPHGAIWRVNSYLDAVSVTALQDLTVVQSGNRRACARNTGQDGELQPWTRCGNARAAGRSRIRRVGPVGRRAHSGARCSHVLRDEAGGPYCTTPRSRPDERQGDVLRLRAVRNMLGAHQRLGRQVARRRGRRTQVRRHLRCDAQCNSRKSPACASAYRCANS